MYTLRHNWHRLLVHGAALAPPVLLAAQAALGQLPVTFERSIMLQSGLLAMLFLLAAFACTPLVALSGWRGWLQIRRALGVYAFAYAAAHLLVYAWYDGLFDPALIWRDVGERRAMAVGLVALLLLAPLALTSTDGWQRRLGPRWRTLHRLIYLAVPVSLLHYLLLERDVQTGAWLAAGAGALLFVLRLPALRRGLARLRRRTPPRSGAPDQPR